MLWTGKSTPIEKWEQPIQLDETQMPYDYGSPVCWRDYSKYVDDDSVCVAHVFDMVSSKMINFDVGDNWFLCEVILKLELALKLRKHNLEKRAMQKYKNKQ